jgi:hypothetical protein
MNAFWLAATGCNWDLKPNYVETAVTPPRCLTMAAQLRKFGSRSEFRYGVLER